MMLFCRVQYSGRLWLLSYQIGKWRRRRIWITRIWSKKKKNSPKEWGIELKILYNLTSNDIKQNVQRSKECSESYTVKCLFFLSSFSSSFSSFFNEFLSFFFFLMFFFLFCFAVVFAFVFRQRSKKMKKRCKIHIRVDDFQKQKKRNATWRWGLWISFLHKRLNKKT